MKKRVAVGIVFVSMSVVGCAANISQGDGPSYINRDLEVSAAEKEEVLSTLEPVEAADGLDPIETKTEESVYAFEDFAGFYGQFNSEDPSSLETVISLTEESVQVGWWMSEYETMDITGTSIEGDTLTIEYFQAADGAYVLQDTWGTFELTLHEEEGETFVTIEGSDPFFKMTEEELEQFEFEFSKTDPTQL